MADNIVNNIINCYLDISPVSNNRDEDPSIRFMRIKDQKTKKTLLFIPFILHAKSLGTIDNFEEAVYKSHTPLPNSIDEVCVNAIDKFIDKNLLFTEEFKKEYPLALDNYKLNIALKNNNNEHFYVILYFLHKYLSENIGHIKEINSQLISVCRI